MSTKVVKKKLTDLPIYGGMTVDLSGSVHYREGGIDYQVPMTSFVTATKNFIDGFIVYSIKEEIVYGGQRLVWTGTYPKTVPSGSTPDTTGGIGAGAWAYSNDSVLRENLSSSVSGMGASLSALEQGGTVQGRLRDVTPYSMGMEWGSTDDCVPYVQAAINAAYEKGVECYIASGIYKVKSQPVNFLLPHDDGTAYPAWVTAGTDANITPETSQYINAAFDIPYGVVIRCEPGVVFEWAGDVPFDIATPTVGNSAPVCFTAKSRNSVPTRGLTNYQILGNPKIKNFFVGRLIAGIINKVVDTAYCESTAISGIWQGGDSVQFDEFIADRDCRVGHVYGGWWTQRNRVASNSAYLPPYPSGDIYDLGWLDSVQYTKYHFYHYLHTWDAYDVAIDAWFNTYFYKSANSATITNGGRATNGGTVDLTTSSFPGISGRSMTIMSRYKSNQASFKIQQFKCLGSFYLPIYVDPKGATREQLSGNTNANDYQAQHYERAHVEEAYVERIGLVNTALNSTATSNLFYENSTSTLAVGITKAQSMCGEGNVAIRFLHQSGAVNTTRPNYAPQVFSGPILLQDTEQDSTSKLLFGSKLWRTDLNGFLKPFKFYTDYSIQQPIYFDTAGYGLTTSGKFYYKYLSWTPTLNLAGTAVTASSTSGYYHAIGGSVQASGVINIASTNVTASAITVSIPFRAASTAGGGAAYAIGMVVQGSTNTPVLLSCSPGASIFSVSKIDGTSFTPTAATGLQLIFNITYTAYSW